MGIRNSCFFLLLFIVNAAAAQSLRQLIDVRVVPVNTGWEAKTGENILFDIMVTRDGQELKDIELTYQYGMEKMPPVKKETVKYKGGKLRIRAGALNTPGFIACEATVMQEGKTYSGYASVGVDPLKIEPYAKMPADFKEFWNREKDKLRSIPLDAKMTLLPERCTGRSDVYHVSFQNHTEGSRIYGILSVPRAPGKYPAILNVPGAGVRPYEGDTYLADDGFISLTIGIHGLPVNLNKKVYDALFKAGLNDYWLQHLESRDRYYYKRVYLGLVRAIDYIFTLPQFDGVSLAVSGGSQGGALAVIAAGLDERVKCYRAFYPALCDLTGYLHGRAGGWPAMFKYYTYTDEQKAMMSSVAQYYDVVNFARVVTVPGFFTWGYSDTVCPPTSMYAAYNVVTGPKKLEIFPETGHWNYPTQWEHKQQFIKDLFGMNTHK